MRDSIGFFASRGVKSPSNPRLRRYLHGGPTPLTDLLVPITLRYQDLTLRFFQTGCVVVDAFSQDWGHDNDWICPPVCLLIRVVKHMELCKARGTVILPLWKSSCFWTLFCRDGVHWNSFVFLPKFPRLFIRGKARNSLFGSRPLNFDVIALRIDFRRPRSPCAYVGFCTKFSKDYDRCN